LTQRYFDGSYTATPLTPVVRDQNTIVLSFTAVANNTYSVLWKESLDAGSWTKLEDVAASSTERTVTITDPLPLAEGRIYRVMSAQPGPANPMPAILTSPKNTIADFGGTTSLTVFAVGNGPLVWQWKANDNVLPNVSGPVLTITNAQFSDATVYSVSVTDQNNGITSGPAYLAVRPRIIDQPQSQVARRGDTIQLSVNAEGLGPLTYRWHRQGRVIAGQTGPTLTLTNVQDIDADQYSVTVTHHMAWGDGCNVISSNAVVSIVN
jgi:hypothetical protein